MLAGTTQDADNKDVDWQKSSKQQQQSAPLQRFKQPATTRFSSVQGSTWQQ
jgi:hypothetical protein